MGLLDSIRAALGLNKPASAADDDASAKSASSDGADESGEADSESSGPVGGSKSSGEDEGEDGPLVDEGERDPELEAQDDSGTFDFDRDIARYFTAEFRVEQAWSSEERRTNLFEEYGVRDTKHWYQIKATFERWLESPEAKAKYPTKRDLLQARMTTTQTMTLDDLNL